MNQKYQNESFDFESFKTEKGTYLINGIEFNKVFIPSSGCAPSGWVYERIEEKK